MAEKIFEAMDADHDEFLDKKEIMALVKAYWKVQPTSMINAIKEYGISESEAKEGMQQTIFNWLGEDNYGMVSFDEWHNAITTGSLQERVYEYMHAKDWLYKSIH